MEEEEVVIGDPVAMGGATLVPVARVSRHYRRGIGGSVWYMGIKQPLAVVVVTPSASRAFRTTGEEIPLDQLIQEFPGIKEKLEEI